MQVLKVEFIGDTTPTVSVNTAGMDIKQLKLTMPGEQELLIELEVKPVCRVHIVDKHKYDRDLKCFGSD